MGEFLKVPPKALGIGQYQYDIDEEQLKKAVIDTAIDVVNELGIDINNTQPSVLRYVSGLNTEIANEVITED